MESNEIHVIKNDNGNSSKTVKKMKSSLIFILSLCIVACIGCNSDFDCENGGICSVVYGPPSGKCLCGPRFWGNQCEIEKKSQISAFMRSFFLSIFALDRFYLEQYSVAFPKLFLGLAFLSLGSANIVFIQFSLIACFFYNPKNPKDRKIKLMIYIYWTAFFLLALTIFLFWIIDFSLILFFVNNVDGRGIPINKDFT
jgi:hypothetical protein